MKLPATAGYGLAGLSGLGFWLRALGPAAGRLALSCSFVALFLLVGAQAAWVLRPFLGDPRDKEVPLFAHGRREGGVLGSLIDPRRTLGEPLSPGVLAVVYVLIGLGCAAPEFVRISKLRGKRIALAASALLTVILWPLWAPFALAPRRPSKRRSQRHDTGLDS